MCAHNSSTQHCDSPSVPVHQDAIPIITFTWPIGIDDDDDDEYIRNISQTSQHLN